MIKFKFIKKLKFVKIIGLNEVAIGHEDAIIFHHIKVLTRQPTFDFLLDFLHTHTISPSSSLNTPFHFHCLLDHYLYHFMFRNKLLFCQSLQIFLFFCRMRLIATQITLDMTSSFKIRLKN